MIAALKDIGQLLLAKEKRSDIDILLENPDSNGKYKIVWVLEFDKTLLFQGVSVEAFKAETPHIYLYKRASGSNAPDFSPTSRVTEAKKTFLKKLLRWFENHKAKPTIARLYKELLRYQDEIISKLEELDKESKDNKILTIKIDGKYLYELSEFREILLQDYFTQIKEIGTKEGVCSVCGETKEVFTTSAIYKFYTLDKACYITGGFNKKEAWKNFPLCQECFLQIEYGKKYVEEHLKFRFYTKEYFLIPKLLLHIPEALEEVNEILSLQDKRVELAQSARLTDDKEEILELLKDYKDVLSFYFLFLKKENAAERILLLVEDVFPSRIHQIFDAKGDVETIFPFTYTFGRLVQFLHTYDRLFFEVIDKIFRGGVLDFFTLLKIFNRKIQDEFISDKNFHSTTLDALANICFFEKLGLLHTKDMQMEEVK